MSFIKVLERDIERPVVAAARRAGWHSWKIGSPGSHGLPDRMFVHPLRRKLLFIEFKRPGGVASPMQLVVAGILRAAGIKMEFCYSVADGLQILELK